MRRRPVKRQELTPAEKQFMYGSTDHWRCYNCFPPHEFVSRERRCQKCGSGGEIVVKLVAVHFLYQDNSGPLLGMNELRYRIACQPEASSFNAQPCTDMPHAVSCAACSNHPKFLEACEAAGLPTDGTGSGGLRVKMNRCCG